MPTAKNKIDQSKDKEQSKDVFSCLLTEEQVKNFNMVFPMLVTMRDEMKALSSKKPDGILNKLKVKMINRLILSARELLKYEPTLKYLDEIDEEMLPQNSDVVLMLSQYIEALEQLKEKSHVYAENQHKWRTQENPYVHIKQRIKY